MHLRRFYQIASPTRSRTYCTSPTRSRTCCTLGLEAMNYYYVLLQDEKGFATDFEVVSNFFWYFHDNCHLNSSSLSRRGFFLDLTSFLIWNSFPFRVKLTVADKHTWYLSRAHERGSCKFFLAGVNFYRFNAKNWHFRQILREKVAFFTDLTRKIGVFRCKFYSPKSLTV